jgi:prophage antirepressor-like protein
MALTIVQSFQYAASKVSINIQGTHDDPLFQANQVGKLLGITNIRESIKDYDDDEKVSSTTATPGGAQQTLFLTELGLYRLLGQSRKPQARPFQKWVARVVREIRLNGKYELQAQVAQNQKELAEARQVAEEALKKAEEAQQLVAAKDDELKFYKAKTYEEVPRNDSVYIAKEASELHSDRHKIGKSINPKGVAVEHGIRAGGVHHLSAGNKKR